MDLFTGYSLQTAQAGEFGDRQSVPSNTTASHPKPSATSIEAADHQDAIHQDAIRQDAIRQDAIRQDAIRKHFCREGGCARRIG